MASALVLLTTKFELWIELVILDRSDLRVLMSCLV
jgi:hypothetical protein